jgi:peptidoglycan L-alanyl-D-glutamate endopeptidase CwlK
VLEPEDLLPSVLEEREELAEPDVRLDAAALAAPAPLALTRGQRRPFDPNDLDVELAAKLDIVLARCRKHGVLMVPFEGLRDPWRQAGLWRRSRTTPFIDEHVAELRDAGAPFLASCIQDVGPHSGTRVTDAIPGLSWHQWGQAVDCYWSVDGRAVWDEDELHGGVNGYRVYAEEAQAEGLIAGGAWSMGDWPHVQLPFSANPGRLYGLDEIDAAMQERFGR